MAITIHTRWADLALDTATTTMGATGATITMGAIITTTLGASSVDMEGATTMAAFEMEDPLTVFKHGFADPPN
jgi:hypothetical protein